MYQAKKRKWWERRAALSSRRNNMAKTTEVRRQSGLEEGARYVETRGMERCVGQGLRGQTCAASKRNLEWS